MLLVRVRLNGLGAWSYTNLLTLDKKIFFGFSKKQNLAMI